MKNILLIGLCLLIELFASTLYAQKKVVALGSSTVMGAAATSGDSSWVGRLQSYFRKNISPGNADTVVMAVGAYGYTTYKELPTDYTAPIPRETIDINNNITAAVNLHPDIIIINLPGNDVAAYSWDFVNPPYSIKETMDNFRIMFNYANAAGIKCYIASTQPRNDLSNVQRQLQRDLVDSITKTFGMYSINFWDDLVVPDGSNRLRDEVRHIGYADSSYHLNNYGHSLLFERVKTKNIFSTVAGAPLPLTLTGWQATLENDFVKLSWSTAHEEFNTSFEVQRCANGKDFQTLYQRNGISQNAVYSWEDPSPLKGKNFYRLKINESAKTSYSRIIPIINDKKQLITSMYTDASQVHLQLYSNSNQSGTIAIVDYSGATLKKQAFNIRGVNTSIIVPISELPSGEYILRITTSNGLTAVERFFRMK
jgi:hypothetical protein